MNSYERVMTALDGGRPDRVPVVPIVREWCTDQVGFKFADAMRYPEKYVYAQYYCLREFGYDAVWDPLAVHAESGAMGSKIEIDDGFPPKVVEYAVKDYKKDLPRLKMPDPKRDGWLPLILEIIKQLKNLCRDEYPVIGYVQAPFRHASMLRGSDYLLRDVIKDKEHAKELLNIATESQKIWGKAVVEAGADILIISDPTSSGDAVSTKTYEEFGVPYSKELVSSLKETGVKTFSHICGNTNDRVELIASIGVDALSVDQKNDLALNRESLGPKMCLIGNVDPTFLFPFGKPEEISKAAEKNIEDAGKDGAFILSSGCLVTMAPPENMRAMVNIALVHRY